MLGKWKLLTKLFSSENKKKYFNCLPINLNVYLHWKHILLLVYGSQIKHMTAIE